MSSFLSFFFFFWLTLTWNVVSLRFHLPVIIGDWFSSRLVYCQAVAYSRSFDSAWHDDPHVAHRKHLHLFGTRARLSASTCWGRLRYAPAATRNAVGNGGRVCEGEWRSRCPGWKKDEQLSKVVLLRSPWQLGWAVIHLQANPKTSTDSNGFSNDKVEQQIILHTDERRTSTFFLF